LVLQVRRECLAAAAFAADQLLARLRAHADCLVHLPAPRARSSDADREPPPPPPQLLAFEYVVAQANNTALARRYLAEWLRQGESAADLRTAFARVRRTAVAGLALAICRDLHPALVQLFRRDWYDAPAATSPMARV